MFTHCAVVLPVRLQLRNYGEEVFLDFLLGSYKFSHERIDS
jgi:hypothetical protein